ncbi:MAG: carboxymuconolactone decarboxylase family protein [Gammaproteobacteria bacterium]
MSKDYLAITQNINQALGTFGKELPEVMAGFTSLSKAATKDGALDKKTKELIALAIGVAKQCDGCIGFHTQALARLGATQAEVMETLGMAVYMGGGPALMYAAEALQAFEQATK